MIVDFGTGSYGFGWYYGVVVTDTGRLYTCRARLFRWMAWLDMLRLLRSAVSEGREP